MSEKRREEKVETKQTGKQANRQTRLPYPSGGANKKRSEHGLHQGHYVSSRACGGGSVCIRHGCFFFTYANIDGTSEQELQ